MNFEQKALQNVEIPEKERFQRKYEDLKEAGKEYLHILTDFDRTLTNGYIGKERTPSIIAQLRSGNFLSADYVKEAKELFAKYHPIETDTKISLDQRIQAMNEWWMKHFELLFRSGLTLDVLKEVVAKKRRVFRPGALEFLDSCEQNGIPVIIMSASLGDMIRLYLEQEGKMSSNIHIVSNNFVFNDSGEVVDIQKPIVHSLNKTEVILPKIPQVHDQVKTRKNVLLMGDGLGDIGMVDGFDANTVLKIGFYNDPDVSKKAEYHEHFDMLVTNDADMNSVNKLLTSIIS